MIHGVDVSRYQSPEAIDGWAFAIVNVEDPGLEAKISHAQQLEIPWGLYTWIYPGNGNADMIRAHTHAGVLGDPPLGYWLDYEQAGVRPEDLDTALDTAATLGILERTGVYTYLHQLGAVADRLRGRPLWLAYYPGRNDGSYPDGQDRDARRWGAVLWQYSSGANLDRNIVLDEAWFEAFLEGDTMPTTEQLIAAIFEPRGELPSVFQVAVAQSHEQFIAPLVGFDGKPATLLQWIGLLEAAQSGKLADAVKSGVIAAVADTELPDGVAINVDTLADAVVAKLGERLVPPTP